MRKGVKRIVPTDWIQRYVKANLFSIVSRVNIGPTNSSVIRLLGEAEQMPFSD